MKTVRVLVSQADIDKGRENNVLCCPVALATRRALGIRVAVYPSAARQVKSNKLIALPEAAKRFISRFDWSGTGDPFEFDIEVDDD